MKGDLTKASGTSNHLYVQKDFVQGIFHEDEFKISVETVFFWIIQNIVPIALSKMGSRGPQVLIPCTGRRYYIH